VQELTDVIVLCFRTKSIRTSLQAWDKCHELECTSTGIGLIKLVLQGRKVTKRLRKKCVLGQEEKQGSVP
jgi:hypothetical protein